MAHHHAHGHPHENNHITKLENISRAFVVGIVLNTAFVIIEVATGIYTNSLALLSDAGHNLSDVAGLGLSLFAFQMAKRKANDKYTYGYSKSTILASLMNAVILFIAVGSIGWESVQRFIHPVVTQGRVISIVAAIGIAINAASAFLFFRDRKSDINIKGAYLHLAADALVSLGVVIAGILITYTGLNWIDPAISLVIMLVVVASTWTVLTESLRLTLDAVPENVDLEKISEMIAQKNGVKSIHHVHIWAMSTTKNAMTAHLVIDSALSQTQVADMKHQLKHELEHHNIQHITLETELECCEELDC